MSKAELLAAVWMANHPNDIADKDTIAGYVGQFDFLVKSFQGVIDNLQNDQSLDHVENIL